MLNSRIETPEEQPSEESSKTARERTIHWWMGWAAFWAVLLIGGAYLVENVRGRRAWNAYVASVTARGESVTVESAIPAKVPDHENLALTPLLRDMFMMVPGYKTPFELRMEVMSYRKHSRPPGWPEWRAGKRFEFEKWREFFRGRAPISPVPREEPAFNTTLRALADFEPQIHDLIPAERSRKKWWAPIRYEDAPDVSDPSWSFMNSLGRLLGLHSAALLQAGEGATAADEISLALRLSKDLEKVQLASGLLTFTLPSIWEGVWDHRCPTNNCSCSKIASPR